MRIACLAWGSLVWDPRTLPCEGPFQPDGPMLPIEFSRVSRDGRVTLVIDPGAPMLRTLWVRLGVSNLEEAVDALGRREKIAPERWPEWVGRCLVGDSRPGAASKASPLAADAAADAAVHSIAEGSKRGRAIAESMRSCGPRCPAAAPR